MRVAVFCSASEFANAFLFDEMEQLGRALAEDDHHVIFGGSGGGCMGALVRGVREGGGRITGVIPEVWSHLAVVEAPDDLRVVKNLSARKQVLNELAEAFVIFPGGLGTLDEMFTVLTMKVAGELDLPVFLYNVMDVWTPVLQALDLLAAHKLIACDLSALFTTLDDLGALRARLAGRKS